MNRIKKAVERIKVIVDCYPIIPTAFGMLQHPVFDSNIVIDKDRNFIELTEENKEELLEYRYKRMRECKNIETLFTLYIRKPYYITIFSFIKDLLNEREYNKILRDCWVDMEFPSSHPINKLVKLFKNTKPFLLMTSKQLRHYNNLPGIIKIYRGTQTNKAKIRGLSWTLDKNKALWFANRWKDKDGRLYEAEINKEDIFMYSNDRNEQELVINPYKLRKLKEVEKNG